MILDKEEFERFITFENNETKVREYYKKTIDGDIEFPNGETIFFFLIMLYKFLNKHVFKNIKIKDFYERSKMVKGQKMYLYIELLYIAYDYYRKYYKKIEKVDLKKEFSIYMFTELLKFNILSSRYLEAMCFVNEILELSSNNETALFFKAIALESLYLEVDDKLKNELLKIYKNVNIDNIDFDKKIVQEKLDFYKNLIPSKESTYTVLTKDLAKNKNISEMYIFFVENKLLLNSLIEVGPYVETLKERKITIEDNSLQKLLSNIYTDFEYCRAKYFMISKQKLKNIKEIISVFLYCFSLFDKVAYFLYKYFDLDIEEKDVYANQNLFESNIKGQSIQLLDVKNEFLFAIYHICCENAMRQNINPKYRSANLAFEIRNVLMHRTSEYDINQLCSSTSLIMKNVRRLIQYLELVILLEEKRKALGKSLTEDIKFNALFDNLFEK